MKFFPFFEHIFKSKFLPYVYFTTFNEDPFKLVSNLKLTLIYLIKYKYFTKKIESSSIWTVSTTSKRTHVSICCCNSISIHRTCNINGNLSIIFTLTLFNVFLITDNKYITWHIKIQKKNKKKYYQFLISHQYIQERHTIKNITRGFCNKLFLPQNSIK